MNDDDAAQYAFQSPEQPSPESESIKLPLQHQDQQLLKGYRLADLELDEEDEAWLALESNPANAFPWLATGQVYKKQITAVPTQCGNRLNKLDSHLVKSHLERFLPTPSTRFHMMRNRALEEIKNTYLQLGQYQKLEGEAYRVKVEALERRLSILQQQLYMLDHKISGINPFMMVLNTFEGLTKQSPENKLKPAKKPWYVNLFRDPLRRSVSEINDNMGNLRQLMQDNLHDPTFAAEQLSILVTEYDGMLKAADRMSEQLRARKSLREKVNEKLALFYRQLFEFDV